MGRTDLTMILMLLAASILLIWLAWIIFKVSRAKWNELSRLYPDKTIEYQRKCRFATVTFRDRDLIPFRYNNMFHLYRSTDYLTLHYLGQGKICIPRSSVTGDIEESYFGSATVLVRLKETAVCILFWGRGAAFVREWLHP